MPWARLVGLSSRSTRSGRGRPPIGLERMLRIYFLQQWYGLADEALEDALYDSQALRGFAGIDLSARAVPDATTVLNFRHWLEQHDLTRALFDEVGAMLEERGLLMRQGTIVDATIIAAPASTKNKSKARDPEMHQTKKGNQWHFGMKAHIGVDVASGVVHTVIGTPPTKPTSTRRRRCCTARRRRSSPMPAIPGRTSGRERGAQESRDGLLEHRDQAQHHQGMAEGLGIGGAGGAGAGAGAGLVEHPFHIVKNLFRHKKLRYRGLAKNTAQLHTLFALANLVIVKRRLLEHGGVRASRA